MHHPFTPAATVPVDPRPARVHEGGQSWSPSGAYALDARTPRPTPTAGCSRPGGE
ncbi:hypothetical protein GCM10010269_01940 [Streptomyces humidus]|uniref:Uncharacterized protein n=1 Tax=Streptomyces humidus TaxID=52259 RepID=A0A918L0M4_9ACTN|nr:hypothetical protein [Streptomyces humidus]GGR66822.1 hypothetical protein GCM10010269_01940 [Streptomyces humidus]